MPHAAALLGLPLFLGFLFVCAILSWFSFVVLGVEARYVGARYAQLRRYRSSRGRSWPALSSAVFPHRFKVHRLGEVFTGALIGFCSVGRGVVGVLAASEIVVDLVLPYVVGQEGKQTWMYVAAVTTIALSWVNGSVYPRSELTRQVLVPLVLYPCMRYFLSRRRPSSSLGLSRFSSILAFTLYPLALLLLGVRLQTLNRPEAPSLELLATLNATLPLLVPHAPFSTASTESEAMGLSIWGGIALIVFSFSSHASTFTFLSSLARPESTRTTRSPSIRRLGSFAPPIQSGGATSNQWPLAAFLGVFLSMLLHLGFGLVGYLGIEQGGTTGNILLEPIFDSEGPGGKDFWLLCARSAILLVLLAGLEGSVEVAVEQVRKGLGGLRGATRENGLEYEQMHSSLPHSTSSTRSNAVGFEWTQSLARVTVWSIMGVVSGVLVRMGREGEGMVSAAEVCACVGNSLVGFLGPCASPLFALTADHLQQSSSSPSSIFANHEASSSPIRPRQFSRGIRYCSRRSDKCRVD